MLGDEELREEDGESGAFDGEPFESQAEKSGPIADGGAPDAALPTIEDSGAAPSESGDPANLQTPILPEGSEADGDILESAPPPSLDRLAPEATLTINAHAGESPTSSASPAEVVSPVYGNTISPAPAAPIGSGSQPYLLPLEAESRPAGADELLQHLPEPATPRLEPPRAAVQAIPNAAGETGGKPLPRVMVVVTLADAKADTNDLLEADGRRMAPQYQQIAKSEIEQERDLQKSLQRAADYRLRGPR
jgi:hypothetical protein